jgi:hypothetical protein
MREPYSISDCFFFLGVGLFGMNFFPPIDGIALGRYIMPVAIGASLDWVGMRWAQYADS